MGSRRWRYSIPSTPWRYIDSYGFAESGNSSPRPDGMEGQPYTGEYILGFWVIPNADQYAVTARYPGRGHVAVWRHSSGGWDGNQPE